MRALLVSILLLVAVAPAASEVSVAKDEKTGEVVLSNETVRMRFHPGKPGQFGIFPKGYTGYTLELKTGDRWTPMAVAEYFTSYVYRSGWGRDWLAYVIPKKVETQQSDEAASVTFTESQLDFDFVTWQFAFRFEIRPGSPIVDVTYTAAPDRRSKLLLFWGPRLYVGEGTFGAAKDEALFPGLEYLGPNDRSSANPALAPDARMYFVPTPAKITIPLMVVVHKGKMAGITWDPLQKWSGDETCPSAVFASPNWIEDRDNHLIGLFVPSVPKYVAENGFRAHTPAVIEAGQNVTISAHLFASPGEHAVDAVDLYLRDRSGLPQPASLPMDRDAFLDMLVRGVIGTYSAESRSWPTEYGSDPKTGPWLMPSLALIESASLAKDAELARRARELGKQVLAAYAHRPLELALRLGNLKEGLRIEQAQAADRMKRQNADGSWGFVPTPPAEGGLDSLHAPPQHDSVAREGDRGQGITASELAPLWDYVLITGDEAALKAALKGLADLDRYSIPFVSHQAECPPSPSLHGSFLAVRCYLAAYRITGERRHLDKAVYWAKTGLPFIYLWSLPPQEATDGYIHCRAKIYLHGDKLYKNVRRDVMLYGGLYGYGSSQFSHHWFGILVHWIPLVYARDLAVLADCDNTLPWRRIIDGILASAMWQTYDVEPYAGYLPDAFSLDSWQPSGPAFSPHLLLDYYLPCALARTREPQTVIAREGSARCHVTSARMPRDVCLRGGVLSFTLEDPNWDRCRAIVAGMPANAIVAVDGKPLPQTEDLEKLNEGWSRGQLDLTLVKVRCTDRARVVEMRPGRRP